MSAREENIYMAKLAEQAERYEEMVEFMEKVSMSLPENEDLTVEERNLLSVAYKNVIGARRASWRIISSIEQKEESRGNEGHVTTIKGYRSKIETELSNICDGILKLLDSRLIPSASAADSEVFYLKMKGDYHRYLAEFKIGAERKEAAESTLAAYKAAQPESSVEVPQLPSLKTDTGEFPSKAEEESVYTPRGLRRRFVPLSEHESHDTIEDNNSRMVKLDAAAQTHIEKHRIKSRANALTNFEVLDLLRSRGAGKDPTRVVASMSQSEFKVFDYLEQTTAHSQTRGLINKLVEECKKYGLAKAEILNIANIRPSSAVEVYTMIKECETRMEDRVDELMETIVHVLPPHPSQVESNKDVEDKL